MARLINVVAAIVFILSHSQPALASARENEFGAGSQSSAMAGTGIASAQNFAATFINPSNLARCKTSSVEFGVKYFSLAIEAKRVLGPEKGFNKSTDALIAELGGCALVLDGLGIGLLTSSNTLEPMTLGLTTPTTDIYMLRFSSAMSAPTLMAGVGYAFIPQISLGIAVQVGLHTHITQDVFAPLSSTSRPFSTIIGATVSPRASVIAGLNVQPWDFIAFAATFRTANFGKLDVDADTQASVFGFDIPPIRVKLAGIHDYSPRRFGFGVAAKPFETLTLNADLSYALWSSYPGMFLTVTADPNSAVSSGITLATTKASSLHDVLIPGVGAEFLIGGFALRAGYRYHPTILQSPDTIQNLVDGDTHQISLGGGFATHNEYVGIRVDAFVATHLMPRVNVSKVENTVDVAYNFGGLAVSTGFNAAVEF